ncbi:unnamed protein product [Urochloa decumbens]|uniref:CCT domain-containing protein n=1 Tax=Urochloa decumbens TaxID=240449 RepID=A0ABC9D931_9POAL
MFTDARFGYSPPPVYVDAEEVCEASMARYAAATLSPFADMPDIEADLENMPHVSFVSEYELGGGDLLEGPEPVTGKLPSVDPAGTANSLMSCSENATDATVNFGAIQIALHSSEMFEEEFMDKSAIKNLISELMDLMIPVMQAEEFTSHAEDDAMMQIECTSENAMDRTVNFGAFQNDLFLGEVFHESKEEFIGNSAIDYLICEPMDLKIPMMQADEVPRQAEEALLQIERPTISRGKSPAPECSLQKSASSECLNSVGQKVGPFRPNFLDFQGLSSEAGFPLRSYSDGDIQNLGDDSPRPMNAPEIQLSCDQFGSFVDLKKEERKKKISRYREKKVKRDFAKKIRYACRKVLADGQPRVRGMFVKIEKCGLQMPTK